MEGINYFKDSYVGHRKVSQFVTGPTNGKENNPFTNTFTHDDFNDIKREVRSKEKNYRGSVIENRYILDSFVNSSYTRPQKEFETKPRWETKDYLNTSSSFTKLRAGSPKRNIGTSKYTQNIYQVSTV